MSEWVNEELRDLNLGDTRLNKRAKTIIQSLAKAPGESIPRCFRSWGETIACYRLLSNPRLTSSKLLTPHQKATLKRMQTEDVVLCLNDTSSIDFTGKESIQGLGTLETENTKGLFIHPTVAVTPARVALGVIKLEVWARNNLVKHRSLTSNTRNNIPIEEKESYRWVKSYLASCDLAAQLPHTQVVSISDREGDIMELLLTMQEQTQKSRAADLIVRSNHNRRLLVKGIKGGTQDRSPRLLKEALTHAPLLGEIEFLLPSRNGESARIVKQQIRVAEVNLEPKRVKGKVFDPVKINAVIAEETSPPEGKKGVCWIFLTSLPIENFEEAYRVVEYYLCRWEIEVFFKVLKSGCEVEERTLRNADRLEILIAMYILVTWRVMYVMMIGRDCPEISCAAVFEEKEWKAVYKIFNRKANLPTQPPSLGELIKMIASLGGYLGRTNDPPPGPKIMWKGLQRMFDFSLAWEAFVDDKTCV